MPLEASAGAGEPSSILVIDDTPANLHVLVGMLKDRGYRVRPAPSGKLAIQAALREPPDLILLDINMPEMNGFEVCEFVKSDDRLKGIPVIFISALTDPSDKVKAFAVGGVDYITKPFQMEELQIRVETQLKLRRLQVELEALQDYDTFNLDTNGHVSSWNPAAENSHGYREEEIIGQHVSCFYNAEDRAANKPQINLRQALDTGRFRGEAIRVRKDGSPFWASVTITNVRNSLGQHTGFAKVVRDISEQKQSKQMLKLLERAIAAFVQGLCITDPSQADNPIIYVNDSFLKITGYDRGDVIGKNCRFLQGPDTAPERVAEIRAALESKQPCIVELLNYQKDGTPFWNGLSISPILDQKGIVTHFVGVLTDITPIKSLEKQFQHAQKMEAFGQLAGGVAHDFNNLLTVISGYSQLLLEELPPDDPNLGAITAISDAGKSAASLTGQLLSFSRRTILEPKVLNLNDVVRESEKLLRRLLDEDTVLATVLAADIHPIKADPDQLGQILMNLAINARDAMPSGGKLTFETTNVVLDGSQVLLPPSCAPGDYVRLAVTDNGIGMTADLRARIFEPFFTTKDPGKGTGLGLATVYGIVKQSNARLEVYSEPGHGTTFKIYFPVVSAAVDVPKVPIEDTTKGGSETILIVEDNSSVRAFAVLVLKSRGYNVLQAENGRRALAIVESYDGVIDLLVTDVVMPGLNGRELAQTICQLRPDLKVLFMSGFTDDSVIRHGILQAEVAFLQKPFTPLLLTKKVRLVLDSDHTCAGFPSAEKMESR